MADWGFGFWWIFPLFFGALWLLLIGLLIWRCSGWARGHHGSPDASSLLRERFARGDIDAEEYEQRRKVLQERP
jgi:putative membrane protein